LRVRFAHMSVFLDPQLLHLDRGNASFFIARTEDPRFQFTAIKASFLLHTSSPSADAEDGRPARDTALSGRGRSILILPVPNELPLPPCCQKEALAASSPRSHSSEPTSPSALGSPGAPSSATSRGGAGVQLLDLHATYPNLFAVCKQMFRIGEAPIPDAPAAAPSGTHLHPHYSFSS